MVVFLRGSWYPNADYVSKKNVTSFSSQYVWVSVTFKILVFDASLFEETTNENNSEMLKSFWSWMFSATF